MGSSSQKNLLIAIALSFVLTAVYVYLSPKAPPEKTLPDGGVALVLEDGGLAPKQVETAPVAVAQQDGGTPVAQAPGQGQGEEHTGLPVKTVDHVEKNLRYRLSTSGAGLVTAELQGQKMREQRQLTAAQGYKLLFGGEVEDAPQMDMAKLPKLYPAALAVGLRGDAPLYAWQNWKLDESQSNDRKVVFTTASGPWAMTKTLEWPKPQGGASDHGYELAMTVTVTNRSQAPHNAEMAVHYTRGVVEGTEEKGSLLGGVGNESKAVCRVADNFEHLTPGQGLPKPEKLQGPITFIGVDQQYFLGAVFPIDQAQQGRCELYADPSGRAAVGIFPIEVAPGQTLTKKFGVYIGPKDVDFLNVEPTPALASTLNATVTSGYTAKLNATVNFGIWEFLCVILLWILKFFHGVFHNWGLAIVFLTLTVKVAVLPLTFKQMVSAEHMKKLQPKVNELRKKFEGDRERQNMEMMKLYQEAKVNPLGGCFPVLIQMPVWIALFTTLRNSYEIYREPFIAPVWMDLTYKDPTYLFPILLGVTWIITQQLQPSMMDAAQQRLMTWVMPISFTVMMLAYPAGLTLYIFTNNLLSILQQYGIRKYLEKKGLAQPMPPKDKGGKKAAKKAESGA